MRIFAVLLFAFTAAPLWATAPLTPEQEERVQELIRETLVAHPDIFEQAVNAWQQHANEKQGQQLAQVIKDNYQDLYQDPGSPRVGAQNPTLTLVSFTDYNCPYCKVFDKELEKIVKKYPQVAVIIKPLPFKGKSSMDSGQLALTLWAQHPQQFLAFHQRLMAKRGMHDDSSIAAAREKTGVTVVTPSDESFKVMRANLRLAEQLGVQGTPATLIGDQMLAGAVPYKQLEETVKLHLETAEKAQQREKKK